MSSDEKLIVDVPATLLCFRLIIVMLLAFTTLFNLWFMGRVLAYFGYVANPFFYFSGFCLYLVQFMMPFVFLYIFQYTYSSKKEE